MGKLILIHGHHSSMSNLILFILLFVIGPFIGYNNLTYNDGDTWNFYANSNMVMVILYCVKN